MQLASAANEPEEGGGGAQQDFGVSASVQLSLVASAVSASSWRFRGRGARARTSEPTALVAVELLEILAVREGIQRPCGLEKAKDRQRCQGVQVSDGLGHQVQLRGFGRRASRTHGFWCRSGPESSS